MACLLAAATQSAAAQIPVSIELVLAVDTSRSVDDIEYDLQMAGIAQAFRSPEVIGLIEQQDGVAVTLFQWNSAIDGRHVIPWQLLVDRDSSLAFAAAVARQKRDPLRGFTAIGNALAFGLRLLAENAFDGRQLKIDISGDGRSNTGPLPVTIWPAAAAQGVVINGLPILIDTYSLEVYFREKVIFGPGAFIEIATDYQDFAEAFLRKLKREITPLVSRNDAQPRRPSAASNRDPASGA